LKADKVRAHFERDRVLQPGKHTGVTRPSGIAPKIDLSHISSRDVLKAVLAKKQ